MKNSIIDIIHMLERVDEEKILNLNYLIQREVERIEEPGSFVKNIPKNYYTISIDITVLIDDKACLNSK